MPYRRKYKKRAVPRRRTGRKPARLAPKTALAVKKIVKSQMSKVVESKILDKFIEPIPLNCLYHNTTYILDDDVLYCGQGTADSESNVAINRVGDSIYVKNVQIKLLLTAFDTRPNCFFRFVVIKTKNGASTLSQPFQHPLCGNGLVCPIDTELPEIMSVVHDRLITPSQINRSGASASGQDRKVMVNFSIPVNRKVKYDNGATWTSSASYKVFILAYDTQAAYSTDNVARFSYFRRTHFLDA